MLSIQELAFLFLRDVFSYILIGYLLAASGLWKTRHFSLFLKWGVVLILFPILIIRNNINYLKLSGIQAGIGMSLCALIMVLTSLLISRSWYKAAAIKSVDKKSFTLGGSIHNYGFSVFPLVLGILGPSALPLAFFYIISGDALFWALGAWILADRKKLMRSPISLLCQIISPPLIALVLSTILILFDQAKLVPALALDLMEWPAKIAIPAALFCIGGIIHSALHKDLKSDASLKTPVLHLIVLRNVLMPLIWIIIVLNITLPTQMATILVIEAIMPSSIGIIFLANMYGANTRFITVFSMISNGLSIISVPLLLGLILI